MSMTCREVIKRTIKFQNPDRLGRDFPEAYGTDLIYVNMHPSPDDRPLQGADEWGAVWRNVGQSYVGQVIDNPLKTWEIIDELTIPDINEPSRWENVKYARQQANDKFLMAMGISLYERIHFLRGLENTWTDIYENPRRLCELIDTLVDMNLAAIEKYAAADFDGYIWPDDWGLQDSLMISPEKWRQIWKPRYRRVFEAIHEAGMLSFLHSCGYIIDILEDLIEVGLDVIQMDQQENMGLELLGSRFAGRITFYSPVDIQATMANGTLDEIRQYCRKMAELLGTSKGGFIPKWYGDPVGAGHQQEAVDAMCQEFLNLSGKHD
jgi:uroporphyrinogen decarboxylase